MSEGFYKARGIADIDNLIPTFQNVIVFIGKEPEKRVNGLIIPNCARDDDNEFKMQGVIISMGWGAFSGAPENEKPRVGDIVFFERFSSQDSIFSDKDPNGDNGRYKIILDKNIKSFQRSQND
jgi:co-chaperonin GroES (HSP10)